MEDGVTEKGKEGDVQLSKRREKEKEKKKRGAREGKRRKLFLTVKVQLLLLLRKQDVHTNESNELPHRLGLG